MKFKSVLLALCCLSLYSSAQKRAEIGIEGGYSYYLGDINVQKQFYSPEKTFGAFYKVKYDSRYALKLGVQSGKISGNDADSENIFAQTRNASFERTVTNFSAMVEFNFLPYDYTERYHFASPYVTCGLSGAMTEKITNAPLLVTIPFGIGFKARLSDKITLGAQWVFHKTFTDELDMLSNTSKSIETGETDYFERQKTFAENNDWYSFGGLFISYKFFEGKTACHAYGSRKKRR